MEYTQRWMWSGWVGAECMWWRWILYAVGIDLENDILWWMEDDAVYFYLTYSTRAHGMSILKNSYCAQWTKHSKIFPMFVVYGLQATLSSSLAPHVSDTRVWFQSRAETLCQNIYIRRVYGLNRNLIGSDPSSGRSVQYMCVLNM